MAKRSARKPPATRAAVTATEPKAADTLPPPISVDEAIARYPAEWILLKVTDYDVDGLVSHGYVVAHSQSQRRIWNLLGKLLATDSRPDKLYYVFSGHPRLRTGEEVRRALQAFKRGKRSAPPFEGLAGSLPSRL